MSLISKESEEIQKLVAAKEAAPWSTAFLSIASTLTPIPDPKMEVAYWGIGAEIDLKVGTVLSTLARMAGEAIGADANSNREQAGISSRTASYDRRADEWIFQANLAARELMQIGRSVIASLIAEQLARQEHETTKQAITNSEETSAFLRDKFSSSELYAWMQGESSRLYFEYYRFAFDTARRAEQTMKRELMRPELDGKTVIQFNYWDGGRKGLLSGEALHLDVKRMEMAYHEHNLREYALTKHVSLLQLEPLSLIRLRATGRCTLRLPEELFDLDSPGHYFRRIKSITISVPCVTGPYTSINCKLTMIKSSVRVSPAVNGAYARDGQEDPRFQDYLGSVQSIVASSGQQDSGLFESDVGDQRYLPFENAGVISEWQIELPANPSEGDPVLFDYDSISDAVLHIRYSARQGGAPLRAAALQQVKDQIAAGLGSAATRLLSVRHEFPTEWAKFLGQTPTAGHRYELELSPRPEHFPYWSQGRLGAVSRVDIIARSSEEAPPQTISIADRSEKADAETNEDTMPKDAALGGLFVGNLKNVPIPAVPTDKLKLYFEDSKLSDLWVAISWSG